jgi:hypothetical protein
VLRLELEHFVVVAELVLAVCVVIHTGVVGVSEAAEVMRGVVARAIRQSWPICMRNSDSSSALSEQLRSCRRDERRAGGRMDGRKTHATASASSSESTLRMSRISSITSVACDENSEEEERRED